MDHKVYEQIVNVAMLPGIQKASYAMPDAHWGYGFPIGGVAAVDADEGAITPGGIGFDVNCGVRLLRTKLHADDVAAQMPRIADALFRTVVLPLLVTTAEACGGFDWDDASFDRAYAELESSLFGEGHAYAAVAPLVGLSVGALVELGEGVRVRIAATGELAAHWPEAQGL